MRPQAQNLFIIAYILLIFMTLIMPSAFAPQTATLSVNPLSGVMTYPTYTINIMISPVTNLNSIHFKLSFNNGTVDFLEVRMGDVKLGAVFAGQQLNMSVGIYHLTDTGLSYVDVLIDLYNNNTLNIGGTQSIAIITFRLLANAMPGMTSWLKLESADAVFYVGGSKPFEYIDEKNGMTLQSGAVRVDYLVTALTMNPVTATVEKPVTISSTLEDGDGNPIDGQLIHYYVSSQEISGSPVTTDAGGISSISYTPSDVGTFSIKAEYVGNQPNGKYASSSTIAPLTVASANCISTVSRNPSVPNYDDDVNVSATITGYTPVDEALLSYTYDETWHNASMDRFADLFSAKIPAQPYRTLVQYKIYANDTYGNWVVSDVYSYTVGDPTPPETRLSQIPIYPLPGQKVKVYANVTEPVNASGVKTPVFFSYRVNGGPWWNTTMIFNSGLSLYEITIPTYEKHDFVEYFVKATDNAGNTNTTIMHHYEVLRCDVNHNGVVDVYDVYTIAKAWGLKVGEQGYKPEADINEDGIINDQDLKVFNTQYGKDP